MANYIHLLQKPTIEGKALALLLEANGHQVQFALPQKKNARASVVKKYPLLYIANLKILTSKYSTNTSMLKFITDCKAIIFLGKAHHLYWLKSFNARTKGFVSLGSKPPILLNVIKKISSEKTICFSNDIQHFMQKSTQEQQSYLFQKTLEKKLTKSELKVMKGISKGKSSQQIAENQCRSIHTINNHRKNIKRKFKPAKSFDLSIFCTLHLHAIHTLNSITD